MNLKTKTKIYRAVLSKLELFGWLIYAVVAFSSVLFSSKSGSSRI